VTGSPRPKGVSGYPSDDRRLYAQSWLSRDFVVKPSFNIAVVHQERPHAGARQLL